MKKERKWLCGILAAVILGNMTGCAEQISGKTPVNRILAEEPYINVILGEGYHQQEVRFDLKNDRAVIPKDVQWGMHSYRNGTEVGISYGESEGCEIYDSDPEVNPELYEESYLDSIRELKLNVSDIRKNNYNIKVVKKKQLEAFEQELALMSGVVIKGEYELTGVNIEFDRRFRPVKKTFRLQALDESQMHEEKKDEKKCIQEFGYNIGKVRFQTSYRDVEKKIQKEWKKILEAERTEALLPYRNQ